MKYRPWHHWHHGFLDNVCHDTCANPKDHIPNLLHTIYGFSYTFVEINLVICNQGSAPGRDRDPGRFSIPGRDRDWVRDPGQIPEIFRVVFFRFFF